MAPLEHAHSLATYQSRRLHYNNCLIQTTWIGFVALVNIGPVLWRRQGQSRKFPSAKYVRMSAQAGKVLKFIPQTPQTKCKYKYKYT